VTSSANNGNFERHQSAIKLSDLFQEIVFRPDAIEGFWPLTGLPGAVLPKDRLAAYVRPNQALLAYCTARCTNGQIGRFTVHVPGRNRTVATVTCHDVFGLANFEAALVSLPEILSEFLAPSKQER